MRPILVVSGVALATLMMMGCAPKTAAPPSAGASACAGISAGQSRTLFADLQADIEGVDIVRQTPQSKPSIERPVGADIHVRAEPGMTAQWLARLVSCHVDGDGSGVLGLTDVTTNVAATPTGFTIAIRSDDVTVAREIGRRAKLLLTEKRPVTTADVR